MVQGNSGGSDAQRRQAAAKARLAEALRDNLRRRKQQARDRDGFTADQSKSVDQSKSEEQSKSAEQD